MTPAQQQQLTLLLEEQRGLVQVVEALGARLRKLVSEIAREEARESAPAQVAPERSSPPSPSPLGEVPVPPPLPISAPFTQPPPAFARTKAEAPAPVSAPAPAALPPAPAPASLAGPPGSLEMTLGTVWLARIGIVILITGLVFLGNYAWQHIVHTLGPAGKISLLALAGAGLLGLGSWLQRTESMRRYAQVLIAGGAATFYYTAYAAHFVPALRVVESAVAGGILLLAVAGLLLWWSERRRLQSAALLTIVLSYYTSAINPVGEFTLYSSLLLTTAAGFLLVRHGWALVSWVSLAGTYGSVAYWRLQAEATLHGISVQPLSTLEISLLWVYWALFTGAVFLARREALPASRRATFTTLNNGLFFGLASQHWLAAHAPGYWIFALSFGMVLLALAALARWRSEEDYALDGAYLVQGLAAVTAGLAMKLTGPSLAVTLAVESAVLLTGTTHRHGLLYRLAAIASAIWSFCLVVVEMDRTPEIIIPLGSTVGALLVLDAWWLKQRSGWLAGLRWSWRAALFAALGLALFGLVLLQEVYTPWEPAALAWAAVAATASLYLLRLPEVVLLGQLYLALAVAVWTLGFRQSTSWSLPLTLLFAALALAHWWQKERRLFAPTSRAWLQMACSLALVITGYQWLALVSETSAAWVTGLSVAAILTLFYGYATRLWTLALAGQGYLWLLLGRLFLSSEGNTLPGEVALLPITALALGCLLFGRAESPVWPGFLGRGLPVLALGYWGAGFAMFAWWVHAYIPVAWENFTLAAVGGALLLLTMRWPARLPLGTGLAYFALVIGRVLLDPAPSTTWQDLLALLLMLAAVRLAATKARPLTPVLLRLRALVISMVLWCLLLWVTRWMHDRQQARLLTLAWSALAAIIFAAGLALHERVYRLGGFFILALAIGRIFVVDVRQLEPLFRILSFLGLGIVLLALGFIYNRYAEKIQKWL